MTTINVDLPNPVGPLLGGADVRARSSAAGAHEDGDGSATGGQESVESLENAPKSMSRRSVGGAPSRGRQLAGAWPEDDWITGPPSSG